MIHIERAGLGSTVQDAGRIGHRRAGVPVSGPADPIAFGAAQALCGNGAGDAAIEVVGLPFAFRCDDARIVAVTGREVTVRARDRMPAWSAVFVRAGEMVTVEGTARSRYAYVAVSGGIVTEATLGSRAAYPRAGLGRTLRAGDALPIGAARRTAEAAGASVDLAYGGEVRAVVGPHLARFTAEALARFFAEPFAVSAQSDRQGVRLDGAGIVPLEGEILACGVVTGAVQVPRGGQPIVLLADHQTTGGYPVVATVIAADLGRVAQRAPGETLRFYRVERAEALALDREVRRSLAIA